MEFVDVGSTTTKKKTKRSRRLSYHWTNDSTFKLIETVEQFECLWNIASEDYKNREAKDASWSKVAQKLNVNKQEALVKWNNLRVSYRTALKNQISKKSGQNGKIKKHSFVFFEAMSFLQPSLKITNQDRRESLTPSISLKDIIARAPIGSTSSTPNCSGDSETDLLTDLASQVYLCTPPSKRRRKNKVLQNDVLLKPELSTMNAVKDVQVTERDSWTHVGEFVASNGRTWVKEYPHVATQYRTELYGLVYKMQQKIMVEEERKRAAEKRIIKKKT